MAAMTRGEVLEYLRQKVPVKEYRESNCGPEPHVHCEHCVHTWYKCPLRHVHRRLDEAQECIINQWSRLVAYAPIFDAIEAAIAGVPVAEIYHREREKAKKRLEYTTLASDEEIQQALLSWITQVRKYWHDQHQEIFVPPARTKRKRKAA